MPRNYARYDDLKTKIIANLRDIQLIEPYAVGSYYLDQNGIWFRKILSEYQPIKNQSFDGLIDLHCEDFFAGTHDTTQKHERAILKNMERALEELSA